MKITVLTENTIQDNEKRKFTDQLISEHGLSLFVEYHGKRYLLDAGSSSAFLHNAKVLGIPVEDTDIGILSHGHYDHAGGFAAFFQANEAASVFAMEQVTREYYSGSGGIIHEIGIPKETAAYYEERFCFIKNQCQIAEGVWLLPHTTPGLEKLGEKAKLYRRVMGEYIPDSFDHELSLVFELEDGGLAVFNSCSHAGIQTIMEEVKTAFPGKKVRIFAGGLHMKGKADGKEVCTFSEAEICEISEYLKDAGLEVLYTGHCTGSPGYLLLQKELGTMLRPLTTGMQIDFQ